MKDVKSEQEQCSKTKNVRKSDQEQVAKKTKGRSLCHWLPWVQRPSAPPTKDTQNKSFIYTVDQLWLWIVNDGKYTIVTATTGGSDGLVDAILDHLSPDSTGEGVQRPKSATEMMELIIGIATDPSSQRVPITDGSQSVTEQKDALQVFQESTRDVIDIEASISENFMTAVKQNHFQKLPERDFGEEFDLLYKIKEIRDELGILKDISNHQEIVWNQAFPPKNKKTPYPFKYPHPHKPSVVQNELRDMMDEAKSAQDSINLFLDLKEKYTASQDAAFGRQQAYTTMVFTIVTIVFLPLTFLSSIFALDIAQFPHGPSGRPQFQSWWIFPLIFGPSAAVAIPLIVVAFNVNDFIVTPYYKWKVGMASSHAASDPGRQPSRGSDDASQNGHERSRSMFPRRTPNKPEDDKV
ncbi:hypothetical protein AtubIFM57258_004417 [Aspergillus tubingensis]|nr:hypothetical protein AtubIFM57258_004417 [Aspergillus tubingensis]